MAAKMDERLTSQIIHRLGVAISPDKMKSIAIGYFNMGIETIDHIKHETGTDTKAFNREILVHWAYKNAKDQIRVLIINRVFVK